jgi:transaldolase
MKAVSEVTVKVSNERIGRVDREEIGRLSVRSVSELKVKLFADGADQAQIAAAGANPLIQGFTTNPTLMRAAGVKDYEAFARRVLEVITDRPISFEVFADEFSEMERQARKIASWAENVYVKIPVTNTRRKSSLDLVQRLAHSGVKINVTAVLTLDQVRDASAALGGGAPAVVSVFAGRIADTGRDPVPLMAAAVELVSVYPNVELIWASPRELLNIFQANDVGCHIITVTDNVLAKLKTVGKDLHDYSLDTVQMFHTDASRSGYQL